MRSSAPTVPARKGKQRLLASCAIAAGMAALALGGAALAQVQGTGQIVGGGGTIQSTGQPGIPPATTRVTTTTGQTIINWTPTDTAPAGAPIDFLPATNTLEFYGTGQYTVLNRFIAIDPLSGLPIPISRQIALNGTVNSYVNGPAGVPPVQGGNIWFYNAGGILIGQRAVINVGSLVLTANDIDTTGGLYGANNEIRFRGAAGSTSSIDISPQSFISAANPGNPGSSYIALVAPRINQGGLIDVDGSAALVAAEQADIRINNGLFDINVTVGAEGGNAITHTGVTGGPAHQQGDTDQSRIYLVAIPKNDAVTMLISGQLGYQDAVVAQTDPDGAVVLSAGYNIANGALAAAPVNTTAANITIADTIFQSSVAARASGALVAGPLATLPSGVPAPVAPPPHLGRLIVQGNATFVGDASATVNVGANQLVGATGNFTVISTGVGAVPGDASFTMTGGQFVAGGNLAVQAPGAPDAVTGDARGGTASVNIGGGANATVIGNVNVAASANAIVGTAGTGGDATGGTASITLTGNGSVLNANSVNVQANGRGGGIVAVGVAADQGGSGTGGSATISVQDAASLTANTSITIAANGAGQVGNVQSGDGTGGTARLEQRGIRSSITSPLTNVSASGTGGGNLSSPTLGTFVTQAGGTGQGGNVQIDFDAAATSVANLGTAEFDASGTGGGAGSNAGNENSAGGDGNGGDVAIDVDGGIALNVGSLIVNATGLAGGALTPSATTGFAGDSDGGTIAITVNGGSGLLSGSSIQLDASAGSEVGDNRGDSLGGDVSVTAIGSGGNSTVSAQSDFLVAANAGGFSTSIPQSTGTSTGGTINFTADGGTITAGSFGVTAQAASDNTSGTGGTAQGGSIDFRVANTGVFSATDSAGASLFTVDAAAGVSQGGTAANAGRIGATIDGGTMSFAHTSFFSSTGTAGGDTSAAGNIVLGLGGTIRFELLDNNLNPSILNFQNILASADGRAAAPFEGAPRLRGTAAGNGGNVTIDVQGGQLTGNSLQISADGFSGIVTGDTSEGRGGQAIYSQTGGAVTVGDLLVSATGFGGSGGRILTGGSGFGGTATIDLLGGTLDATDISAVAAGAGGVGLDGDDNDPLNPVAAQSGGLGQGGTATINLNGTAVVTTTTLSAFAAGVGGDGGNYVSVNGIVGSTGNGGNGEGGTAEVNLVQGTLNTGDITADASGIGGFAGSLLDLNSLPVGGAAGGFGGSGQGGTATIGLATAVTATGTVSALAVGAGGDGGIHNVGGDGGEGRGGTAQLIVTDFNVGTVGTVLDASALGGNGGDGANGEGGRGGFAQGGTARVQTDGAAARAVVTDANFITTATGGAGGSAALHMGNTPRFGPNGGNGGDARGGTVELAANSGGTIELAVGRGGVAALGSFGIAGDGGDGADNPETVILPGPDGMPGTMDDIVTGFAGGQGGAGGGGYGGTVRLAVNGGTISSGGNPVAIDARGTSGTGGLGGAGFAGSGGEGGNFVDQGGTVVLEAFGAPGNPGRISFGDTTIDASGALAGRIDIRSAGTITMTSLTATAQGSASPTNNDTDLATTGIFLGITDGGLIQTDGAVTLDTAGTNGNQGASVGVYAQGDGQLNVGGALTVNAGDQVDIRHDFRDGTAPTIQTGTQASFTAVNSIRSAPGSLVSAGTSLVMNATGFNSAIDVDSIAADRVTLLLAANGRINVYGTSTSGIDLTANARDEVAIADATAGDDISLSGGTVVAGSLITNGTGLDSELDGSNIFVGTTGAASVEHAEADNDFTADVGSFTTGLDTIITGGDIDISSLGAVDLGNSQAGGFIAVTGQSIVFNEIDAGTTVGLTATGVVPGGDAILGNRIDAGDNVTLIGNGIRINDGVFTTDSLFANASGGNARLSATTDGDIIINSAGDIAGTYAAGGNVRLTAATSITAQANAAGTYVGPNGPSEGYVFIDAAGDANVLAGSAAATMIGVRAGTNANVDGTTAGEDIYVLAGNTATVTNSTAGDDMIVTGTCCVIVDNVSTTGAGPDGRSLIFAPAAAGGPALWQLQTGPTDLSNIVLTASAGTIDASNAVAFDNLTATASDVVRTTNTIRSGLVTTIAGSSLDLESVTAGTDIILGSTAGSISAIGALSAGHDLTVTSATTGQFADLAAGDDIRITAGGDVSAASVLTTAGGLDNEADFSGAYIDTPGNITITGTTNTAGQTRLTAGGTVDTGAINADFTFIDAVGAINIAGDVTSGGMYVEGSSVDMQNGFGGANQIILRATDSDVTVNGSVTTLSSLEVDAAGAIAITGTATGGNYVQMQGASIDIADVDSSSFVFLTATGGQINATGTITAGSDVILDAAAGGTLNALIAGDDVSLTAGGDVTVASITAEGSNPQGEEIGSNVVGSVNGILTVTGSTFAASDVTFDATSVALQDVEAGGSFTATATGGPISLTTAEVGGAIALTASGIVTATGLMQSGSDTTASGASLNLRGITAGGDVDLTSTSGDIVTNGDVFGFNISYDAARDILLDANDRVFADRAILLDAGRDALVAGQLDGGSDVTVQAARDTRVANVLAGDDIRITGGRSVVVGNAEATSGSFFDDEANGNNIVLISAGTLETTGTINAANLASLRGTTVTTQTVFGGPVSITSTVGDVNLGGNVVGFGGVTIDSAGDILQDTANRIGSGNGPLTLTADGDVAVGRISGGAMQVTAAGTLATQAISGGSANLQAGGAISVGGDVTLRANFTAQGSSIDLGANNLSSSVSGSLDLTATAGDINATGTIDFLGSVTAEASGAANLTGDITAFTDVDITGSSVTVGNVASETGDIALTATGGALTAGALDASRNILLDAGGAIELTGNATAGLALRAEGASIELRDIAVDVGELGLTATTGGVNATGAITANGPLTVIAAGAVDMTGDIDAAAFASIRGASVTVGNLTGGSSISLTATNGAVNSAGTIDAGANIFISTTAGGNFNRLIAGDDIGIIGSGDVGVTFMDATGNNPEGEEIGSNVEFNLDGNVTVGHGEAAGDFIVNANSFSTGLNSIIAEDDIEITTSGATNLGNSTAGGNIIVIAQSIDFNALDAGLGVSLAANGDAPGAEGIRGVSIDAGDDIGLSGNSIAISGAIDAGGSFEAFATGGDAAFDTVNSVQRMIVEANGDIGGTFTSTGDIRMFAFGDIGVTANALGGATDPDGFVYDGNLFIDAEGDVVLTNSSAGRMLGVNALGAAELTNVSAGEDLLVRTGGFGNVFAPILPVAGANGVALSNVTAGDDLEIRSVGDITASNVRATGQGTDGFILDYGANGFTISQGEGGAGAVDGSDIVMTSGEGAINASGLSAADDILLTAAGAITLNGAQTLGTGVTGGGSNIRTSGGATLLSGVEAFDDLIVDANGTLTVATPASAGRDIDITATTVEIASLTAPNNAQIDVLDAGRDLGVRSATTINGGAVAAGRDLSLSAGGSIALARTTSGTGGTTTLTGAGGVNVSNVISGSTTDVTADQGAIVIGGLTSAGPISLVGDSISVSGTGGNAVFANIQTDVGDATIFGGGNMSVTAGSVAGRALIRSDGSLSVTQLSGDNVELSGETSLTLGTVTATDDLGAATRGMLTVNGAVVGRDMILGSDDITIGANGRLGTGGTTQTLQVANITPDSTTYVGGTGTRDGWHIDATEMTRLFGTDITILAPDQVGNNGGFVALAPGALAVPIASVGSSTPPNVIIDDFTMTAGSSTSNLGTNGSLTIRTQGKARVIGDALFTGMGDANAFRINADDSIEVILGEGTIRLTGGSTSTPGGMLVLESEDVIVATADAIADVAAAPDIDAVDERLGQNDGIVLNDGALFAGGMDVSVEGGFHVQNSGEGTRFAQRRGLTFGALGLNVNVAGADSRIVINGVHLGPSGQVTGLDAIPLLSIDGFVIGSGPLAGSGLAFDSGSTMNGCLIVSSTTCAFLEFESSFPVQDVINDDEDEQQGDDGEGMGLPTPLITMRDLDPLTGEPLLDDPVTGAGNDDLWTPPAE